MNEEKLVPVPIGPKGVELRDLDSMFRFATCYLQSGLAPQSFKNAQQLVICWAKAAELGLSPLQAVEGMSIINNRVGIMGDLALAMVEASGLLENKKVEYSGENDGLKCTVTLTRKGRKSASYSFSVNEAIQAQIYQRSAVWKAYPRRMTYYRALGFGLRDEFADVLKGTKTVEELQDYPDLVSDEEKILENQRREAEIIAHPPPGVKIIAQSGIKPTPAEALEPAFPEDLQKPPAFAQRLAEDFQQQKPVPPAAQAVSAPALAPERKTDPYQKEAPDDLDMSPKIQAPLPPEPAAPDLWWKDHQIKSVEHVKFFNRKVGELTQRELAILENQWLPLILEQWEDATEAQQVDAKAFQAAIAFSKEQKPW